LSIQLKCERPCEEILQKLDDAIGIERTTPEIRNGALARQIAQRIKSSFLGILVIDEMQRLKFSRTGGESKEGANKRGNSSRLTQSFHFFMFEPIFLP
jgi:ribosomal protein S6E (S10)